LVPFFVEKKTIIPETLRKRIIFESFAVENRWRFFSSTEKWGDFLAEANMVHMASRVASAEELARMQEKMHKMMHPGWSSATLFM